MHFKNLKSIGLRIRYLLLAIVIAITTSINILQQNPAHAAIGSVSQYPVTSVMYIDDITLGPDNNIWYTGYGPAANAGIGKVTPSGVASGSGGTSGNSRYPEAIAKGSDGNIWFSEQYTVSSFLYYRIVKVSTSGIILGQYQVSGNYVPKHMTLGPDGSIWFATSQNKISKIDTSGSITDYAVNVSGVNVDINDITTGPDGNLWFAASRSGAITGNAIGKITTSGVSTSYSLSANNAQPKGITTGPDGNLWFTESTTNKVGKITTSGVITKYLIPTTGSQPWGITAGSDGALWFTYGKKIGRVTTSGTFSEYSAPQSAGSRIITGPDGAVWFISNNGTNYGVGRLATELTNQTISFTSSAPTNANLDSPAYTPTASATSGLPVAITVDSSSSSICSIDGAGKVSYQSAGTCTLNANQAGNVDYNPAPQVQQSFTVLPVNADTSVALNCPTTASVNDAVTCTITITNNGPAAAENASLTALFPSSLSNASLSGGGTLNGQYITWSTPSLASGDSVTLTLSATASVASKARLSGALLQTSPDPNNSNNLANVTIGIS